MDILLLTLLVIAILVLLFLLVIKRKKKAVIDQPMPPGYRDILARDVPFYRALPDGRKAEFETRMMHFLATTRITGVNVTVEDRDTVYVAASAIIPIFGFAGWEYGNLHEVLLYPDSFNHDFEQTGAGRPVLGMVGDGAMNHVMILSQHELRQGFVNTTGKTNTAIHEFVHLVDKSDGSVDGVPELFVQHRYVLPWLRMMRSEIGKIMADRSDINAYGATNEAEFFAVVSEYFFERPDLLATKHPELYESLTHLFRQRPTLPPTKK